MTISLRFTRGWRANAEPWFYVRLQNEKIHYSDFIHFLSIQQFLRKVNSLTQSKLFEQFLQNMNSKVHGSEAVWGFKRGGGVVQYISWILRLMIYSPKIVNNLPMGCKKLRYKGEPYRLEKSFCSYRLTDNFSTIQIQPIP